MERRARDRQILFPWERRGGLLGRLRFDQARPFLVAVGLLGLVSVVVSRERSGAGVRRTRSTVERARVAVDAYMADHDGGCPPGGFAGLARSGLPSGAPLDEWGRPLRLSCPGHDRARYDLASDGPDGVPGGIDRIE